jgi:phospholipid-binding lipoprotein MlaA
LLAFRGAVPVNVATLQFSVEDADGFGYSLAVDSPAVASQGGLTLRRFGGFRRDFSTLTLGAALGLSLAGCGGLSQALHHDALFPTSADAPPRITYLDEPSEPAAEVIATPLLTSVTAGQLQESAVDGGASSATLGERGDVPHVEIAAVDRIPQMAADGAPARDGGMLLAQATAAPPEVEEYDPWESFNETMFDVNLKLDKYVLKPAARAYRVVMPEPFQLLIDNGFSNIRWVPRFMNSLFQAKWEGAGRELARFLINSTAGIGGLFDPAKDYWGIRPSKEDFGQTLGVYGYGPGPYLVLPLLPPMTVRDGIGTGVDGLLDPLSYFIPFIWDRLGMRIGDTINDRAINYELFQGVEETTVDLYSSVRHFYLNRREQMLKE